MLIESKRLPLDPTLTEGGVNIVLIGSGKAFIRPCTNKGDVNYEDYLVLIGSRKGIY